MTNKFPATAIKILALAFLLIVSRELNAESLPQIRPALIGSEPNSLINLIDTQSLMKKGQGDGIVLFYCQVAPDGKASYYDVFRYSDGGKPLKDEVRNKIYQSRFVPAVYNHHRTYAWFMGTVMFHVADGKPHLRIYANHQTEDLKSESDFIQPQSIYISSHYYEPVKYPAGSWSSEDRPAVVDIKLSVDASGNISDVRALKENPPGKKFGETAVKKIKTLTFLPGFRNGKPVASTLTYPYVFMPSTWMWKP